MKDDFENVANVSTMKHIFDPHFLRKKNGSEENRVIFKYGYSK